MELLTMSRSELSRLEACQRLEAGILTQIEVARQLDLSDRQVRRLLARYRRAGPQGLRSARRGRPSNRRTPAALLEEALALVRDRYDDFGPTFANQKLRVWKARNKPYRRVHPPRERRPCFGELVQIDGSPHDWLEKRGPRCTLLVFIDDATSRLVALRFAKLETTWEYLNLLRDYISTTGRPLTLYSDRHSIFRSPHSEYAETRDTQLGQALRELDIELLCATTPQAKGRVERANRTLQTRLLRELRLRNIATLDDANAYLPEFLTDHNERFAADPRCEDDLHRSIESFDLPRILCYRHERIVSTERTFQIGQIVYAIDDQTIRPKTRISIREQQDGKLEIVHAGKLLSYRKLRALTQAAITDSKQIRQPVDRHVPDPRKGHKPAATHPWRSETPLPLRHRATKADFCT